MSMGNVNPNLFKQAQGVQRRLVELREELKERVVEGGKVGRGLRSGRALNHAKSRSSDEDSKARSSDGDSFRLRLYWEEGYFWQECKEEMWWCMREFS